MLEKFDSFGGKDNEGDAQGSSQKIIQSVFSHKSKKEFVTKSVSVHSIRLQWILKVLVIFIEFEVLEISFHQQQLLQHP